MDYEFTAKQLQADLRNVKEIIEIHRRHFDANDASIAAIQEVLARVVMNQEVIQRNTLELQITVGETQVAVKDTQKSLQELIQVLTKEHGNGAK